MIPLSVLGSLELLAPPAPEVVAVIPAVGGLRRGATNWLAPVAGVPLIVHTLRAALAAHRVQHVVVRTDDPEIAGVARALGAIALTEEPRGSHHGHATHTNHATHWNPADRAAERAESWTLERLARDRGIRAGLVVTLSPNHPIRSSDLIDRVVAKALVPGRALATTWAPLGGRANEWWIADGEGYRPLLDTRIRERVRGGEVEVYRLVGSVIAERRSAGALDAVSLPFLAAHAEGAWVGELVSPEEAVDVTETKDPRSSRRLAGTSERTTDAIDERPSRTGVRVVLAPPISSSAAPSSREPWLARGQRMAARLSSATAFVVGRDSVRPGLVELAARVEERHLLRRGDTAVLIDTRFPSFALDELDRAVEAVAARRAEAQVGALRSADRAALAVAVEDGIAQPLRAHLHAADPRANAASELIEPAGFVVWSAGSFPFELLHHRIAERLVRRLDEPTASRPEAGARPTPTRSRGAHFAHRSAEEVQP